MSKIRLFAASVALIAAGNAAAYATISYSRLRWQDAGVPFELPGPLLIMVSAFLLLNLLTAGLLYLNRKTIEAGGRPLMAVLGIGAAVIFILAVSQPPAGSADNYWNVLMSRGWLLQGKNPYTSTSADVSNDPLFHRTATTWQDSTMVYGPLWTIFAAVPVALTSDTTAELLLMKVLVSAAYAGAGLFLFFRFRQRFAGRANLLLAVWLLNPFAVFEIGNNAHNEGLLVLALALFVAGLVERRPDVALPGLAAASLIKIWPLILLPPLFGLHGATKKRWAIGLAAAAGLTVASFAFFGGPGRLLSSLMMLSGASFPAKFSPGFYMLWRMFSEGPDASLDALKLAVDLLFVLFGAAVSVMAWKKKVGPVAAGRIMLFVFFGAVMTWLQPWYFVAAVPFLLIPEDGAFWRGAAMLAVISCFGFAAYSLGWASLTLVSLVLATVTAATFAPALLDRKRRRSKL